MNPKKLDYLREPSEAFWLDEETGLYCFAKRMARMGHWCGYVESPRRLSEEECEAIQIHGGITFADNVCLHLESADKDTFMVGFDCAHCDDLVPFLEALVGSQLDLPLPSGPPLHYWTLQECREECGRLARQVRALSPRVSTP